jgi:hypothetical protein
VLGRDIVPAAQRPNARHRDFIPRESAHGDLLGVAVIADFHVGDYGPCDTRDSREYR